MKSISASIIVLSSVHLLAVGLFIPDNELQVTVVIGGAALAFIGLITWARTMLGSNDMR